MTKPDQQFAYFLCSPERIASVVDALVRDGFAARSANRMVPGVTVRVRVGTGDEARATQVVENILGGVAKRGPEGSPTQYLPGYREGMD